jgi:hypothetical protein
MTAVPPSCEDPSVFRDISVSLEPTNLANWIMGPKRFHEGTGGLSHDDATSSSDDGATFTLDFCDPPARMGHHVSWCAPLDMR